ncbi:MULTISPECIES: DUF3592 domain-containing protein [Stenotrophomonas]|uniref:DUF3592 domain-containing protein n=1 Tax=Stenotrophomonas TaxID=40323 RepID=UPI00129198B6|nr:MULTISPECIES: DUF3592 domain-containing protein [Stenotrophomonas]
MTALRPDGRSDDISVHWLWATPLAIGLCMLALTAWFARDALRFRAASLSATGEVVGVVEVWSTDRDSDGQRRQFYCPRISFIANDDQPHQFVSGQCSFPADHATGDAVKVRYRADAPDEARLDSTFAEWGLSLIWGGLGLLLTVLGVGLGVLLWPRRSMRRTRRRAR